jgi:hypothetical protein
MADYQPPAEVAAVLERAFEVPADCPWLVRVAFGSAQRLDSLDFLLMLDLSSSMSFYDYRHYRAYTNFYTTMHGLVRGLAIGWGNRAVVRDVGTPYQDLEGTAPQCIDSVPDLELLCREAGATLFVTDGEINEGSVRAFAASRTAHYISAKPALCVITRARPARVGDLNISVFDGITGPKLILHAAGEGRLYFVGASAEYADLFAETLGAGNVVNGVPVSWEAAAIEPQTLRGLQLRGRAPPPPTGWVRVGLAGEFFDFDWSAAPESAADLDLIFRLMPQLLTAAVATGDREPLRRLLRRCEVLAAALPPPPPTAPEVRRAAWILANAGRAPPPRRASPHLAQVQDALRRLEETAPDRTIAGRAALSGMTNRAARAAAVGPVTGLPVTPKRFWHYRECPICMCDPDDPDYAPWVLSFTCRPAVAARTEAEGKRLRDLNDLETTFPYAGNPTGGQAIVSPVGEHYCFACAMAVQDAGGIGPTTRLPVWFVVVPADLAAYDDKEAITILFAVMRAIDAGFGQKGSANVAHVVRALVQHLRSGAEWERDEARLLLNFLAQYSPATTTFNSQGAKVHLHEAVRAMFAGADIDNQPVEAIRCLLDLAELVGIERPADGGAAILRRRARHEIAAAYLELHGALGAATNLEPGAARDLALAAARDRLVTRRRLVWTFFRPAECAPDRDPRTTAERLHGLLDPRAVDSALSLVTPDEALAMLCICAMALAPTMSLIKDVHVDLDTMSLTALLTRVRERHPFVYNYHAILAPRGDAASRLFFMDTSTGAVTCLAPPGVYTADALLATVSAGLAAACRDAYAGGTYCGNSAAAGVMEREGREAGRPPGRDDLLALYTAVCKPRHAGHVPYQEDDPRILEWLAVLLFQYYAWRQGAAAEGFVAHRRAYAGAYGGDRHRIAVKCPQLVVEEVLQWRPDTVHSVVDGVWTLTVSEIAPPRAPTTDDVVAAAAATLPQAAALFAALTAALTEEEFMTLGGDHPALRR